MGKCIEEKCKYCPTETILKEIADCKFLGRGGSLESHRGYMALLERAKRYEEALDQLSRLGNWPLLGNSDGNRIARRALKGK